MASDHVFKIIQIITDKNKNKKIKYDIMYEKINIGPTLNFNKKLYTQPLNKTFGTYINKSMIFNALKRETV